MNIGKNDLERKMLQAQKWLKSKNQVRVTLTVKGRERSRPLIAADFVNEVCEKFLDEYGKCAKKAIEGSYVLTYNPK